MGTFIYRLVGATVLDAGTYEGIESDRRSIGQAAAAVILSSIAAGIGGGGWHGPGLATFVGLTAIALVSWLAWAMLTFQIGSRWLPGPKTQTSFGELSRTVGFAAAPGLLQAVAAFPQISTAIFVASWIWMFAAMVVAVKHALDYDSYGRAMAVCGLSAAISLAFAVTASLLFVRSVS
jgi:hypothetical protein